MAYFLCGGAEWVHPFRVAKGHHIAFSLLFTLKSANDFGKNVIFTNHQVCVNHQKKQSAIKTRYTIEGKYHNSILS